MIFNQLFLCIIGLVAALVSTAEARLPAEGIIGGENAQEGQIPYQVSIQLHGRSICGGCVVGERYVVTAGHCVTDGMGRLSMYRPYKVVAGTVDLEGRNTGKVTVDVAEVIVNKEFDPTTLPNRRIIGDIAVLKLNSDLGLASNPNIRKINLPQRGQTYAGLKAVISGFGWNKVDIVFDERQGKHVEKGLSFKKLRFADANVLPEDVCQTYYSALPVSHKHICAAVVQRDHQSPEGICAGDSGGPLVYGNELIGVVSTSPLGCSESQRPAVYTRVSEYLDFVNNAMSGVRDDTMATRTLPIYG